MSWFNHQRLLELIGDIPPAEAEQRYYRQFAESIAMPVKMDSAAGIDALIQQLNEIKVQSGLYSEIEMAFFTIIKEQRS